MTVTTSSKNKEDITTFLITLTEPETHIRRQSSFQHILTDTHTHTQFPWRPFCGPSQQVKEVNLKTMVTTITQPQLLLQQKQLATTYNMIVLREVYLSETLVRVGGAARSPPERHARSG